MTSGYDWRHYYRMTLEHDRTLYDKVSKLADHFDEWAINHQNVYSWSTLATASHSTGNQTRRVYEYQPALNMGFGFICWSGSNPYQTGAEFCTLPWSTGGKCPIILLHVVHTPGMMLINYKSNASTKAMIVHELIHAHDHDRAPVIWPAPNPYAGKVEYYNHPGEMNGYFYEGLHMFRDYLTKQSPLPLAPGPKVDRLNQAALAFWHQVGWSWLTPENRKKMLKRIFEHIDEYL